MDLHIVPGSPPCSVALLVAKSLKLNLNVKTVNLLEGEHKKPEFLKMNPQHTVPTLDDSGFYLCESRAIIAYLANKYGSRDEPLYSKDPKVRAIIDQRLYFDAITFYPALRQCYLRHLFGPPSKVDPDDLKKLEEVFDLFETFLNHGEFAIGDNITLADLSLVVTVYHAELAGFDVSKYTRVESWYKKVQDTAPGYKEIVVDNSEFVKKLLSENILP